MPDEDPEVDTGDVEEPEVVDPPGQTPTPSVEPDPSAPIPVEGGPEESDEQAGP